MDLAAALAPAGLVPASAMAAPPEEPAVQREEQEIAVARVPAASVSAAAGPILREVWTPPVMRYSDEYLAWQFGFPGPPAIAAIARRGEEAAGVIAMTPRHLHFRGEASHGYVLSFLGVRPSFQGHGLAGKLYAEIMTAMREQGLPSVVFVEAHSARAHRLLFKTVERLGFRMKPLGAYPNHGWMRRGADEGALTAREARDPGEVLAVIGACGGDRVLWASPDEAQLSHHLRDPRGRRLLVVEEEGRLTAAATAMLGEIVNKAGGVDRVITVNAIWAPEPTPERIAALFRGAAAVFEGKASAPVVSAPSVAALPAEMLRPAGLRPTGAVYDGYLLYGGEAEHPFFAAEVTNIEVL